MYLYLSISLSLSDYMELLRLFEYSLMRLKHKDSCSHRRYVGGLLFYCLFCLLPSALSALKLSPAPRGCMYSFSNPFSKNLTLQIQAFCPFSLFCSRFPSINTNARFPLSCDPLRMPWLAIRSWSWNFSESLFPRSRCAARLKSWSHRAWCLSCLRSIPITTIRKHD